MGQKSWLAPGEGKHARGAGLIQNGPRTAALASDPRDTTRWPCVRAPAGEGSPPPSIHRRHRRLVQQPGWLRQAASPRLLLCRRRGPSPELVPLVPLSVLVLLGSWVLQVRDIGKVILFRKP